MILLRLLLLLLVLVLQNKCQGLRLSHRHHFRVTPCIFRLRGGGEGTDDSTRAAAAVEKPDAPEEPIAFVDITVESQQPLDYDGDDASKSPATTGATADATATASSGTQSDSIATGAGIKSIVKSALVSMKSAPVEALKRIKDKASIDTLKAKTSAVSPRALMVNTLLLFGSPGRPLTPLSVLSLSLFGSALGFKSYLWFATIGYTVAVGLISLVALIVYNILPSDPTTRLANLQSLLVLAWSVRLTAFLLYREYIAWPSLHRKSKEVNEESHDESKLGVWMCCGAFYAAMAAPCCYRLQAGLDDKNGSGKWGFIGKYGIFMQFIGLIFESAADAQKATFKAGNRDAWCNVGLWKFFSHPNYLGEVTFWIGTFMGGIGCYTASYQYLISIIGLVFIACVLKSATDSLSAQELRRYGKNEDYLEFRRQRGFLGPFKLIRQPEKQILL
mmetsp:Transcript_16935/g.33809  ORF Transcript_16935/g.33809 Transcript_16935/m.33809 type:complete len:446 (-) Transcript_16935:824-2161(-)